MPSSSSVKQSLVFNQLPITTKVQPMQNTTVSEDKLLWLLDITKKPCTISVQQFVSIRKMLNTTLIEVIA